MINAAFQFEDFSTAPAEERGAQPAGPALTEDQRLEAYEQGFKAGWDDANEAQSKGNVAVETAAAQTLSDLSFTLAEAKAHTLATLKPLMEQLAHTILPKMAEKSFAPLIVEKILDAAQASTETNLTLRIAPEDRTTVELALIDQEHLSLSVIDEETLATGQAHLDLGDIRHEIDLPKLTEDIQNAVSDFYQMQPELSQEQTHAL